MGQPVFQIIQYHLLRYMLVVLYRLVLFIGVGDLKQSLATYGIGAYAIFAVPIGSGILLSGQDAPL